MKDGEGGEERGGDSCDCIRSTRSFFYVDNEIRCYKKRANTLSRWREEIRVLKEPDALGHAVASCGSSRNVTHEQEVQQEQGLESMRTLEAQLRLQLHPEEQKVASFVDGGSLKGTFESKRQAGKTSLLKSSLISRRKYQKPHQPVISWRRSDKRLAKQKVETAWLRAGGNSQHHIVLPPVLLGNM